jgi:hypothetical protein
MWEWKDEMVSICFSWQHLLNNRKPKEVVATIIQILTPHKNHRNHNPDLKWEAQQHVTITRGFQFQHRVKQIKRDKYVPVVAPPCGQSKSACIWVLTGLRTCLPHKCLSDLYVFMCQTMPTLMFIGQLFDILVWKMLHWKTFIHRCRISGFYPDRPCGSGGDVI